MHESATRTPIMSMACAAFADIDEQAAALNGWNQRYQQLSPGRFRGEVRRIRLEGVGIFIEDLQQSVHQTGFVERDVVAVGVPLVLHGDARFCGQASAENLLHVFSGHDGFEFRSPQRHVMLGIEIDASLFASCVAAPAGLDAGAFARHARLECIDRTELDGLRQMLLGLLLAPQGAEPACLGAPPLTAAGSLLRDAVLDRLSQALASARQPAPRSLSSSAPVSHALIVERAQQCVRDRLGQPPTVAELCEQLGVSRRTLQTSFQDTWGMGPLAWLRMLRLNAVRRALKTAPSVTTAATQLGFWHFGRFSHDYQALFGELPSQTFRRHHGLRPDTR
jgi:AraC family ethanolamine operon transcriptional activator